MRTITLVNGLLHGRKVEVEGIDGDTVKVHHFEHGLKRIAHDGQCVLKSACSYIAHYDLLGDYGYYKGETANPLTV